MSGLKLILTLLLGSTAFAAGAVTTLSTAAQDNSPKFIQQAGKMAGIGVDVLRAIEKIDPELRFTGDDAFWPQKRIENGLTAEVASGPDHLDVFVGLGKTPEREKKFRFTAHPVYSSKNVLFVRADDKVSVKRLEDIKTLPGDNVVLANNGYVQASTVKAIAGLRVDDGAKTNSDNLKKLVDGKGRFFFASELSGLYEARQEGLTAKIHVVTPEGEDSPLYVVYSAALPKATADRLETAIKKLLDSGEMGKILARYK